MINKESLLLFLQKEGKVLNGHRSINLFMLFLIFLISLLSISFAKAGLYYLEAKMNDPFVKWVDIKALQRTRKGVMPLSKFLAPDADSIQAQYSFSNPKPNYTHSAYFCKVTDGSEPQLQGRSFDVESSLFGKIVEKGKNGIVRIDSIANSTNGIIITLDALKDLGYINSTKSYSLEQLPRYVQMSIPYNKEKCEAILLGKGNDGYYPISIPVLAIVKDIPGVEYSFMFSQEFMDIFFDSKARDITSTQNNQRLHLYGKYDNLKKVLESVCEQSQTTVSYIRDNIGWDSAYVYASINVNESGNDTATMVYLNHIANQISSKDSTILRLYDFESHTNYRGLIPLYSIEVSDLKKIRALQSALKNECDIRLDMRNIESQENFQKMEAVGTILSISIIILALLFVTVFIFFLLNTHFQSIQMNLGTFKAFGIDNAMLYSIYLLLMSGMTFVSFMFAWILCAALKIVLDKCDVVFEQGFSMFDIFSMPVGILFCFAMIDAIAATLYIAFRKLNHTPGDLIYNRNKK